MFTPMNLIMSIIGNMDKERLWEIEVKYCLLNA